MDSDDERGLRGRYEPLETVGRGGQGEVLKARDRLHDRLVAIKVRAVTGAEGRHTLLQEARVLLELVPHAGFPVVRDDFFEGDQYYLVMDWVEGTDLETLLRQRGDPGLPFAIVLRYVEQVARTLDHLHAQVPPVIHQDVKPANLILTPKGRVVLVDFGIAGSRAPEVAMGTPHYAAPELARGDVPSAAADIYGLAATTHALLTGAPPRGDTAQWEDVPQENVSTVEHALGRGLAFDPARRPGSAEELVERLRARLASGRATSKTAEQLPPSGVTVPLPATPSERRGRVVPVLAAMVMVAVGLGWWFFLRTTPPATAQVAVNSVAPIDPGDGSVGDGISVGQMPASIIAVDQSLWVANLSSGTITHIDAASRKTIGTIASGGAPTDISGTSEAVWVANELAGNIVSIDPGSNQVTATLELSVGVKSIAVDGDDVWVTNAFEKTLMRVSARTNSIESSLRLPGVPADVAVGFGSIWVSQPETNGLLRIEAGDTDIIRIALRGEPDQIAVGDDAIWVTSPETNQIFRVDPEARTSTAIEVGNTPAGIAVRGADVWVANYLDGTVTRIDADNISAVETISVGNAVEGIAVTDEDVWVTVHAR